MSQNQQRGSVVYRVLYPGQKPFEVRADGMEWTSDRVSLIITPLPEAQDRRPFPVLSAAWSSGICIVMVSAVVSSETES